MAPVPLKLRTSGAILICLLLLLLLTQDQLSLVMVLCVLGCEVNSDVNVSSQKFNIKLFVPEADGMTELWLRLESVCIVLLCLALIFITTQ